MEDKKGWRPVNPLDLDRLIEECNRQERETLEKYTRKPLQKPAPAPVPSGRDNPPEIA